MLLFARIFVCMSCFLSQTFDYFPALSIWNYQLVRLGFWHNEDHVKDEATCLHVSLRFRVGCQSALHLSYLRNDSTPHLKNPDLEHDPFNLFLPKNLIQIYDCKNGRTCDNRSRNYNMYPILEDQERLLVWFERDRGSNLKRCFESLMLKC